MNAMQPVGRGTTGTAKPRRFARWWRDHEEGVLYAVAAVIYIPAGVFLRTIALNWMLGILFPLIIVYLVPNQIRRYRSKTSGTDLGGGS